MEDWKEYNIADAPLIPLTDLVEFIVDNRGKTVPTASTGIKLIATNCIRNEHLFPLYEKVRFVSEDIYNTWFRSHPKPGDIIFVNKGTPGKCALVPDPVDFCIAQDMMAFRLKSDIVYNKYLLAILRSREIQTFIMNNQVGTIIPHFKKEQLKTLMIPLPKMQIQKRIGDFYVNISEKAEINRRINENLEQQAQALYKSWFVDFEPFKADELVESELGMIPKGWRVYSLSEFLPVITGKKDANVAKGGVYPFFSCSQDYSWTDYYSFDGSAILVAGNGDFNVKMYVGKFEAYQRTYVLIPYNPSYTAWLYYAVKYHLKEITSAARGSVIKFITKGNLADFKFAAPSSLDGVDIITKFDKIRKKVSAGIEESRRLEELRDTLLPKLMSGEINVNEVKL